MIKNKSLSAISNMFKGFNIIRLGRMDIDLPVKYKQ